MLEIIDSCRDADSLKKALREAVGALEEVRKDPKCGYQIASEALESIRNELGLREGWY